MTSAISNVASAPAVSQPANDPAQKQRPAKSQPETVTDSVKLSRAAQTAAAAFQEARETPAQTSQEANRGDLQAKRVLAKEAAAKPVVK